MALIIFLNLIGVAIFYTVRYQNRSTKDSFSLKFWIKRNWVELGITLLFDIAALLILLHPATDPSAYLEKLLPSGLVVAGKPATAFLIGVYFAYQFYTIINKKLGINEE